MGKRKAFGRSRATPTFEVFSGGDFAAAVKALLLSERRACGLEQTDLHLFEAENKRRFPWTAAR